MKHEILNIKNLSVGYDKVICSSINATVKTGELVGLAGKNGSGKSTLIRSILGLQPIFSGNIEMNGEEISKWNSLKRAKEVAVVFSRLKQVPAIPVHELVALGRLPYRNWLSKLTEEELKLVDEALQLVEIKHLRNLLANELSDGQLQMVMIARALVQDTPLIIMDEPTSHLDIENQFKIFELIHKLTQQTSKTFIIASHQVELLLQNATQLWWINNGEFFAGFPEQIAYEQKVFEQLSQDRIRFDYTSGRFRFQYPTSKKIHFIEDGSDLSYWTKHSLERNGFQVSNEGMKVEVKAGKIILNDVSFDSLDSFMEALLILDK